MGGRALAVQWNEAHGETAVEKKQRDEADGPVTSSAEKTALESTKEETGAPLRRLNIAGIPESIELEESNSGRRVLRIRGGYSGERLGYGIGSGDFNDDGVEDVILTGVAPQAGGRTERARVIFGQRDGFEEAIFSVGDLDGSNGFTVVGDAVEVSKPALYYDTLTGDFNGDGVADFLIFSTEHLTPDNEADLCHVVFGRKNLNGGAASLNLTDPPLNGTNGFVIVPDRFGLVYGTFGFQPHVSGDFNGDGIDDILVAETDSTGTESRAYIIFGSTSGFGASLELASLNGTSGFVIVNKAGSGKATSAGDLNGDGIDDIFFGAPLADSLAGRVHVIFGRNTTEAGDFNATVDVSALNGSDGFAITGDSGDRLGGYMSGAGDFNADGVNDILLGAPDGASGRLGVPARD
uniref:Uncharacterized protein n=1 Tax=Chromera velia CCMP2878 TaxID=1169474 RepID=A0A0G4G6M4_9ALVE|eukprot:Cvel_20483.t1-p1 / transcript=Cvel_20483.t1 / gene=Cvel_20483 / organism=Chromera_velia_CCMP2878 / gene_product=Integrin alpha-V, putative / transcript_product=Integrin alpha-V, putative / location=Cvel_scaffold1841:18974-22062(+) / protein_length=407 / sequence_SO=supercontig / SO=protein_coding / is_pseudo=false